MTPPSSLRALCGFQHVGDFNGKHRRKGSVSCGSVLVSKTKEFGNPSSPSSTKRRRSSLFNGQNVFGKQFTKAGNNSPTTSLAASLWSSLLKSLWHRTAKVAKPMGQEVESKLGLKMRSQWPPSTAMFWSISPGVRRVSTWSHRLFPKSHRQLCTTLLHCFVMDRKRLACSLSLLFCVNSGWFCKFSRLKAKDFSQTASITYKFCATLSSVVTKFQASAPLSGLYVSTGVRW